MEGPVTDSLSLLGEGWGEGLSVEPLQLRPSSPAFSQEGEGRTKLSYGFASNDESGRVCSPKACGFSPMIAAAKKRGT